MTAPCWGRFATCDRSRMSALARRSVTSSSKKTRVGRRTKAHHVGYLGDAIIGDHVNIGAGTIFVNYDGVAKHQTTVGDGAFVGSNSSLVAPLTIGEGAYIAAGSVITKDVPADALVLERSPQVVKEGWAARRREKQAARQKG